MKHTGYNLYAAQFSFLMAGLLLVVFLYFPTPDMMPDGVKVELYAGLCLFVLPFVAVALLELFNQPFWAGVLVCAGAFFIYLASQHAMYLFAIYLVYAALSLFLLHRSSAASDREWTADVSDLEQRTKLGVAPEGLRLPHVTTLWSAVSYGNAPEIEAAVRAGQGTMEIHYTTREIVTYSSYEPVQEEYRYDPDHPEDKEFVRDVYGYVDRQKVELRDHTDRCASATNMLSEAAARSVQASDGTAYAVVRFRKDVCMIAGKYVAGRLVMP